MLKRLLFASVLSLLSIFSITPAFAREAGDVVVSINPSEQEINLRPGEHFSGSVTVYNVGRKAFDFTVFASPYQVQNSENHDYDPDFVTENAHTRLASWITFPETEFHVDPDKAVEVKFEIDVPTDILGGGQYAAVIIRTDDGEDSDSSVNIISQLASLVYGHVKGAEMNEEGEMIEHDFPSFILGDNFRLSSVFENYGNVDFRVTETITIKDFFTKREIITPTTTSDNGYPIGTTSAAVLPGTTRAIDQTWDHAPQLGLFRVKQTISFLDQNLTFEKIVFICPLWLVVLVGIFILLIIIWIISHIISSRRERPQAY